MRRSPSKTGILGSDTLYILGTLHPSRTPHAKVFYVLQSRDHCPVEVNKRLVASLVAKTQPNTSLDTRFGALPSIIGVSVELGSLDQVWHDELSLRVTRQREHELA